MLLNEGFQDYLAKPVRKFYLERMLRKYMPPELAVNIEIDDIPEAEPENKENKEESATADPKDINFDVGLANVGGLVNAFASVVNAYYKEGLSKLDLVPKLLADNDIDNYVVNVHALKSSSAAIGANAMSTLFRELEFAGKAQNIEFIESHSAPVFETFAQVLDVVKNYLTEKGLFEGEDEIVQPEGEETEFDDTLIDKLINALTNFNIKETEDTVHEIVKVNYGQEVNETFFEINKLLDVFDYHKAKELLIDLKRRRDEQSL